MRTVVICPPASGFPNSLDLFLLLFLVLRTADHVSCVLTIWRKVLRNLPDPHAHRPGEQACFSQLRESSAYRPLWAPPRPVPRVPGEESGGPMPCPLFLPQVPTVHSRGRPWGSRSVTSSQLLPRIAPHHDPFCSLAQLTNSPGKSSWPQTGPIHGAPFPHTATRAI